MIEGVKTKLLKVIPDGRGRLMEILRSDEEIFLGFGQVYLTTAYPGVVKAWHYHKKQADNFACLRGMVKVVLYDRRDGSPTVGEIDTLYLGDHNPMLLQIPPEVWHGFMNVGTEETILLNCPTRPYNREEPDEYRIPPHDNDIPYDWRAGRDG